MKGLSKREALKGVRSFLKGTEKKQFTASGHTKTPRPAAKIVRCANGVQLTLKPKDRV